MKSRYRNRSNGSALLAVYWAIAILSLAVFTTLQFLLFEVSHTNSRSNRFLAEQLAHSAAAIASHPTVERHDPILTGNNTTGNFRATITSEGSRLPINQFLNPQQRIVMENLFEIWGMNKGQAKALVDQMIDWTDSDSAQTGSNGRERGYYFSQGQNGYPYNRPFQELDEIALIENYPVLAEAYPEWRTAFTTRSSGKLDVNTASADLIAAVCECSLLTAEHFVETRNGVDGIPLTEDDLIVESVEEALDRLQTYGEDRDRVGPRFSIDDPVKRIVSTGTVGNVTVEQTWVVGGSETIPQVIDFSTRQINDDE